MRNYLFTLEKSDKNSKEGVGQTQVDIGNPSQVFDFPLLDT